MDVIVYGLAAFCILFASISLAVYAKKKYPGLLLFSGMLFALSGFAIYLVNLQA